jgi:hypothetical protein
VEDGLPMAVTDFEPLLMTAHYHPKDKNEKKFR